MQRYFREVVKRVREFPPFQINERRAYQFRGLFERWVARSGRRESRVLFYPDLPHPKAAIHKICYLNGYDMANDPSRDADLAIHWRDETFREADPALDAMAKRTRVINYACRDISKKRVDVVFRDVFGYTLMIDPLTHCGPCVVKSDLNALHDGKIMICPVRGSGRIACTRKWSIMPLGKKSFRTSVCRSSGTGSLLCI